MNGFPVKSIFIQGKHLRVEDLGHGIKKIIFTRPDIRNAFHEEMIHEIQSALKVLSTMHDISEMRLLFLEGEGKVFCAGADLAYMRAQSAKSESENLADALT